MLTTVLIFALITALFEAILLWHFSSSQWLTSSWHPMYGITISRAGIAAKRAVISHSSAVHLIAVVTNLVVHFGTITGTMTAITAGLVSFATVPMIIWAMRKFGR